MKAFITLLLFAFLLNDVYCQETDIDSTLAVVANKAEKNDYSGAIESLQVLIDAYPENESFLIYKGRIYAWQKYYAKSIEVLKPLADKNNPDTEALEAIINTYYWSLQYRECIIYCNKYLSLQPNTASVMLIKANCLEKLNEDEQAEALLSEISITDSNNPGIQSLRTTLSRKKKNAISASYLNISTENQSPLHYGYVEYLRKIKKSSVIARANVGHVNNTTEGQFEVDFYHSFNKSYVYVNAGVGSGSLIFPRFRAGAEYYFSPLRKFDFSLGGRYLGFESSDVTLATGHIGYNYNAYNFAYRPFYDIDNQLLSHIISVQKTNEAKENIIRLELQYGNVPYLYIYNNVTEPLTAYRVGLQYQHRLKESLFIRPIILYEYEEFLPDTYRNRLNVQLIVTKRF